MSHAATNWAIKQRGIKPAAKIVLWHLCDRYNPDYGCFVAQEKLADDCEMSRSALNARLDELEEKKLISRTTKRNPRTKRQERTEYAFAFQPEFALAGQSGNIEEARVAIPDTAAESGFEPEPSPDLLESRVRNPDSNLVREPVIEPVKDLRENAPERAEDKPFQPKWRPIAPDLEAARQAHADIVETYRRDAVGGIGAIGISEKAIAALADLPEGDIEIAVEACQRWLRSLKAAHKSHTPTIETYVKSREFDHHPRPIGIAALLVPVNARSREWCALFWALIAAGDTKATGRARAMHRDAKFNKPTHVRNDELPTVDDCQGLVKIERSGEEFTAWRRHLGFRGPGRQVWIEGEAFGEWLWVPTRMPPKEPAGMTLGEDRTSGAAA